MALSKSQFLLGLQCPKALWLRKRRPELADPVTPGLQAVFDQGQEVGALARRRYPGGRLIAADHRSLAAALEETRAALREGADVLFEAALEHDGVLVRADVLIRNERGAWDLIEVKSTTEVKDAHLDDLAVQRYVVEGAGLPVRRTFLLHVNGDYVRNGPIDPEEFFTPADVTKDVAALMEAVPGRVRELHAAAAAAQEPPREIGPHCEKPYPCPFKGRCWGGLPEYSVYDIARVSWKKLEELRGLGVLHVRDVPDSFALSEFQREQVRAEKTGRERVERKAIAGLLKALDYPLHFLDFETVNPALPPYDGLRPFQKLPFQASVHVQAAPGAPVSHAEFLGDGRRDPRAELAEFLTRTIGPQGTVVAYNASFEGSCLEELADAFAQHAQRLRSVKDRLWDLADPFRKALYVHPGFRGSWSIKAVLPVLAPGMSYKGLDIGDGEQASLAYLDLMRGRLGAREAERALAGLRRYCAQDTLGMVELLDRLRTLCGPSAPAA